jgi:hypothetical protein
VELQPPPFRLPHGDEFGLNFTWYYDKVPEYFDLTDSIGVDPGEYRWEEVTLYFSTFRGRRWQIEHIPTWGTFYNGRKVTLENTLNLNFSKHFNVNVQYTWNQLTFRSNSEDRALTAATNELAVFPVYSFDPRLSLSVFGQWNSLNDVIRVNARLHWIPRIGSDLFLVLDESHSPADRIELDRPTGRSVVGKLVWRFTF